MRLFHFPIGGQDPWELLGNLESARWYPTGTVLSDGRVLITGGREVDGTNVLIPEIFDPDTRTWANMGPTASKELYQYPNVLVVPDGRVFYSSPSLGTAEFETYFLDLETETWSSGIPSPFNGESAVMYEPGKVMKAGGHTPGDCLGDEDPDKLSIPNTAVIDLTVPDPTWRATEAMYFARRRLDMTLLPDGTVLVTGGTGCWNQLFSLVRAAEL